MIGSRFDRILLRGLILPCQRRERAVGFFNIYRQPYPASRVAGIAEKFPTWLKARARRNIPVIEVPHGRGDDFVDSYFNRASADDVATKGQSSYYRWVGGLAETIQALNFAIARM